ncbi:hypothetical protein OPV22_008024 [Ensete ventricosum]|uniref:Uncharacterized protein n=1 Tax=Ensete ventricosum TaxID=4639 RepID=A0AAV8RBB9_ENSVE|nr:hypothetical protein OPV22_008024 [Ensete ventricosum]
MAASSWSSTPSRPSARASRCRRCPKLRHWSFSSYRSFSPHIGAHDHESRHAHCHGLKADARVHINCARILEPPPHCRGPRRDRVHNPLHRRPAAEVTQSGSVWSFGLSTLIVGFDPYTGVPTLYQIDPPGTFSAWKDNATGRNFNSLREFLAKNYKETSGQETVNLAIGTLLEVVESGGKNIENFFCLDQRA